MHCSLEMRNHITSMTKICKIYERYPELLNELTLDKHLTGHCVCVAGHGDVVIPGVDPLLFNTFYFITCNDQQARDFQFCFPGWDQLYLENYNKENRDLYCQTVFLIYDILHGRSSRNSSHDA